MGREVGCMIIEGQWLFVGIPDAVKVCITLRICRLITASEVHRTYLPGVACPNVDWARATATTSRLALSNFLYKLFKV
jgi:hypothetical protein